jgi:hypothetical protein
MSSRPWWWLSCLPLDPRFMGSNPAENVGFLTEKKIRSTTFLERELKSSAPGRKISRYVKETYEYERDSS